MTRRDYIRIANLLSNQLVMADRARDEAFANGIRFTVSEIAHGFSKYAMADNDRFDRERFFDAVGISSDPLVGYTLDGREVR